MDKSAKWSLPVNASDVLKELVDREAELTNSDSTRCSQASGGKYCSVVGCSNNQARDIPRGIKFHKFPSSKKRRQLWVNAIKRGVPGRPGELWQPAQSTVICSVHFYDGKKSDVEGSPGYVPSIFPTHHVKPKTKADEDRFKRQAKFQLLRSKVRKFETTH